MSRRGTALNGLDLLPRLAVKITNADGSTRTVTMPDPRGAFIACFEQDNPGATCEAVNAE